MRRRPMKRRSHYIDYPLTTTLTDSIASINEGLDVTEYDELTFGVSYTPSQAGNTLRMQAQVGILNEAGNAFTWHDIPLDTENAGILELTSLERQYVSVSGAVEQVPMTSVSTSDRRVRLLLAETVAGGAAGVVSVQTTAAQIAN